MEDLDFNSIVDPEELFNNSESIEESPDIEEAQGDNNETNNTTEEYIDGENPFSTSESVGSDEYETIETPTQEEHGSSQNFYSSIAEALAEDGVLYGLNKEEIDSINSPELFAAAINKQVEARLDERFRRIEAALSVGAPAQEVTDYEETIEILNGISNEEIKGESEESTELRRNLIYQDFINRGYSQERAAKEVNKSFAAGTDVEDALEALHATREFATIEYNNYLSHHANMHRELNARRQQEADALKKYILSESDFTRDFNIDQRVREEAFYNIAVPRYRDNNTGEVITALEVARREDPANFARGLGLAFTLTNGFRDMSRLMKGAVQKKVNSKLAELEGKLSSPSGFGYGDLSFVTSADDSNGPTTVRLDI